MSGTGAAAAAEDGGAADGWAPARRAKAKAVPRLAEEAALRLEREERVWGLAEALRSREVSLLLLEGYRFVGVIRGGDATPPPGARPLPPPSGRERVVPIPGNRWGDQVILGLPAEGGSPA
jgi:hypothetical protein